MIPNAEGHGGAYDRGCAVQQKILALAFVCGESLSTGRLRHPLDRQRARHWLVKG